MVDWWLSVRSVADAVSALPERTVSAGGTLIKPEIAKLGLTGRFVDVSRVASLARIERADTELVIGALVRNEALIDHADVLAAAPELAHAARSIGNPHVRRAGTIGGNIACRLARASLPPALLALDARVRVTDGAGERDVPLASVLRDGVPPGALITHVVIPRQRGWHIGFDKIAWRDTTAKAIATAAIAVRLERGTVADARLVAGGLCVATRLPRAEDRLRGGPLDEAAIAAVCAIARDEPPFEVTDVPAGEAYRRGVLGATLARLLAEVPRG